MRILTLPIPIPIFIHKYHTDTDTDFLKNTDIPIPIPIIPIIGPSLNYKLELPIKAQWIQGKKSKILLDPFDVKMFLKEKKGSKAFYRCSCNKTKHCPVRATLNMDTDMIERLDGFHNHDTDLVAENVKKIIDEKMDTVAANPTVSPRSVMTDITAKVLNDPVAATGVPSVPKYNTIAKMVQRKRKLELSCPKLPKEWKDMIIPDSMKTT